MKQAIIIRTDLNMPKGKLAVQVAHASVEAVFKSNQDKVEKWANQGMPKIILKAKDIKELKQYYRSAKSDHLTASLIKDAGKTFFRRAIITCIGIGPDDDAKIDKITKDLKLV